MRPQKYILQWNSLLIINLVAIVYNASIYLLCDLYVAAGLSHSFLERLDVIPGSPSLIFWVSN